MSTTSSSAKVITLENASACSPYELRQELLRRNAFDIDPETANYRTMLQRLMIELVKEDEAKQQERLKQKELEAAEAREKAKQEREARKAEALERSRQRREADPEYFQRRQQTQSKDLLNVTGAGTESGQQEVKRDGPLVQEINVADDDDNQNSSEPKELDPFRAYKPTGRNRVYVK
jgi:hypothetical protein